MRGWSLLQVEDACQDGSRLSRTAQQRWSGAQHAFAKFAVCASEVSLTRSVRLILGYRRTLRWRRDSAGHRSFSFSADAATAADVQLSHAGFRPLSGHPSRLACPLSTIRGRAGAYHPCAGVQHRHHALRRPATCGARVRFRNELRQQPMVFLIYSPRLTYRRVWVARCWSRN